MAEAENRIFIVGGGPSLRDFPFSFLENKKTIAINKSIFSVKNPTHFITMDFTFLSKIQERISLFQNTKTNKVFVANLASPYLQDAKGKIIDTRSGLVYTLDDFNMIIKSYKVDGMGYSFNDFRTGENTGFCALQLAVLLGYTKIYLLGIDLDCSERTHYHEGYNNQHSQRFQPKLLKYAEYFKRGIEQLQNDKPRLKIISCSPTSCLNEIIEYTPYESLIK